MDEKDSSSRQRSMPQKHLAGSFRSRLERRKVYAFCSGIALLFVFGFLSSSQGPTFVNAAAPSAGVLRWLAWPVEIHPENREIDRRETLFGIAATKAGSSDRLVAVGDHDSIFLSTDGGTSWLHSQPADGISLFSDPSACLSREYSSMRPSRASSYMSGITFIDPLHGWAVGGLNAVASTTDGGKTWIAKQITGESLAWSGAYISICALSALDTRHVWAVGLSGTVIETIDGGTSWRSLEGPIRKAFSGPEPGLLPKFFSITFSNATHGWIAGEGGTILATDDGGVVWQKQNSTTKADLYAIVSDASNHVCAVGAQGTIVVSSDGGANWSLQHGGEKGRLHGVSMTVDDLSIANGVRRGWAIGDYGVILQTVNGGVTWERQAAGLFAENLYGLAVRDASTAWAVGEHGTILHTDDAGKSWRRQEPYYYRRYPAPWFYFAIALTVPLLVWSALPVKTASTGIQDRVTADSPVDAVEDDRLGQRALVERLAGFLQNQNTLPPLVISLQAPWGMGKSTVMRMLQTTLVRNRAAVTVWFNAWHHQKEDALLAYLLETIQKQAVPEWLSRKGIPFRLNLVRVRLLNVEHLDRSFLILVAVAFLVVQTLRPEWLLRIPGSSWIGELMPLAAALPVLNALIAFKSNPEKLTAKTGGFLVDTLKEVVRLPALIGKSDVRQEFANNLRDVVASLRPQRLVIFLDDLDRCRPDQVVQILESINFLSSVAQCFLVVGADYEKVETLVANEFENIALREAENKAGSFEGLDKIHLRLEYARQYMRKIVNLRLNLRAPANYLEFLKDHKQATMRPLFGIGVVGIAIVGLCAMFAVYSLTTKQMSGSADVVPKLASVTGPGAPSKVDATASGAASSTAVATGDKWSPAEEIAADTELVPLARSDDGARWRKILNFGLPLILSIGAFLYWLNKPRKIEEAQDVDSFTKALEEFSGAIFGKNGSPREARRFLNYLRLVATSAGQTGQSVAAELRKAYPDFDHELVGLAVGAISATREGDSEIKQYYRAQCELFGLDYGTFQPREKGIEV